MLCCCWQWGQTIVFWGLVESVTADGTAGCDTGVSGIERGVAAAGDGSGVVTERCLSTTLSLGQRNIGC